MRITLLLILLISAASLRAQDPANTVSSKQLAEIAGKAYSLETKLDKKSEKALADLKKQESKLQAKLGKIDSVAGHNLLVNSAEKYKQLEEKLKAKGDLRTYIPHFDSLGTSLKLLNQNDGLLKDAAGVKDKLKDALSKVDALKEQLKKAEDIKQFLKERKEYLEQQLEKFGLVKDLKKLNKQVYYYSQQFNEYKAILNDPKKIGKKAIELLAKTKFFKDFFRKNSMLASLFRIPDPDEPLNMASFAGLQTRVQVNNIIQQQIQGAGPNGMQRFQEQMQSAQSQMNELKNKILKSIPGGGGSSDDIMPEGFKPNEQKTKSFLQRLEYGTNIQTQKSSSFFPTTTDIGLSLGYKLNDKSIIGIGASYKMGLGRGWNAMKFTSEGAGLRSYIDWKLKGSLWISGGYEMNYKAAFSDFDQLRDRSGWQRSGLIGVSKSIPVKSKFFKKTKAQLLWDFLSYQQVPKTQAVIFRINYNFK